MLSALISGITFVIGYRGDVWRCMKCGYEHREHRSRCDRSNITTRLNTERFTELITELDENHYLTQNDRETLIVDPRYMNDRIKALLKQEISRPKSASEYYSCPIYNDLMDLIEMRYEDAYDYEVNDCDSTEFEHVESHGTVVDSI
jgi:hypothetical protein